MNALIKKWYRLISTMTFILIIGQITLKAQTFSIYYTKGLSEQFEFITPNDPYHGQVLTLIVKTGVGLQMQKENFIYELGFNQKIIDVPFQLRYLNLESARVEHWTNPENIMNSANLHIGKRIVSKKHFTIDVFSGLNLGYFDKEIRAYKNPKTPPNQRLESIHSYSNPMDSLIAYSSFSRGYFTSKANFSIPLKCALNLSVWRLGVSIIPFFELGLNNYYKMTQSYYIPEIDYKGYAVTKLNGTNYGINFRVTYKLFDLEVLKPKIKSLLN